MFSFTVEKSDLINILLNLEEMCSSIPLEVSKDGVDVSLLDTNKYMAFAFHFEPSMFKSFDFSGEGTERYVFSAEIFKLLVEKDMGYPIEVSSTMDSMLQLKSTSSGQIYKMKLDLDEKPESSGNIRNHIKDILKRHDKIIVKALRQDIKNAVRGVKKISSEATVELYKNVIIFKTSDSNVEAEASVQLKEENKFELSRTFNLAFLYSMLSLITANRELSIYLFKDYKSILFHVMLTDTGNSSAYMILAPIAEKKAAEEPVETGASDDALDKEQSGDAES